MKCMRCKKDFESNPPRGYCGPCVAHYEGLLGKMRRMSQPMPNVCMDGTFTKEASPKTVNSRCGLCGSSEVSGEYGMASGYGLGVFQRCWHCHAVLDFVEDSGE